MFIKILYIEVRYYFVSWGICCMTPKLIRFVIELQNEEKEQEQEQKYINFKNGGGKRFFNIFARQANVTIPIDRD